MKKALTIFILILISLKGFSSYILIPMGNGEQKNHLKAYGIAFWTLEQDVALEWMLNYRGGSFLFPHIKEIEEECLIRGVSYEILPDAKVNQIKLDISSPSVNQEIVKLEKAPKIAVYTPEGKQPWDDAVTMVLEYAEIPYVKVYDEEVIKGDLHLYDWLHLHHEDFTGQYGKFYGSYRNAPWYKEQEAQAEAMASKLGFQKVSEMKLAVAKNIKNFTLGGGFLFTMCSGTDSFDIALAAQHTDICEHMYDGDAADREAQSKLEFNETFAFRNFKLKMNPLEYEYSDIDATSLHRIPENQDKFTLFDFSAKWDIVPTMLCQNHTNIIDGFMGQTTDFKKELVKPEVIIMGENKALGSVRYIHGTLGKGQWTFYGGHDPEDYRHYVGDPPTDLNLYPNSPGYRLILNNILFPAAKKKHQKT